MGVGALSDNNVCIISTDGKTNKQLLSARDGIEKPGSVDYRPMDGTLITGCENKQHFCTFVFIISSYRSNSPYWILLIIKNILYVSFFIFTKEKHILCFDRQ